MIIDVSINLADDGTTRARKFEGSTDYVGHVQIGTEFYGSFLSEATVSFKTKEQVQQFIETLKELL